MASKAKEKAVEWLIILEHTQKGISALYDKRVEQVKKIDGKKLNIAESEDIYKTVKELYDFILSINRIAGVIEILEQIIGSEEEGGKE